jgi:hypothetical protein
MKDKYKILNHLHRHRKQTNHKLSIVAKKQHENHLFIVPGKYNCPVGVANLTKLYLKIQLKTITFSNGRL